MNASGAIWLVVVGVFLACLIGWTLRPSRRGRGSWTADGGSAGWFGGSTDGGWSDGGCGDGGGGGGGGGDGGGC